MKFKKNLLVFLIAISLNITFSAKSAENDQVNEFFKNNLGKITLTSFTIAAYSIYKTINTPAVKEFIKNPNYQKFHNFCLNNFPEISLSFFATSVRLLAIYFGVIYRYDPLDLKNSEWHIKVLSNLNDLIVINLILQKILSKCFIFMTKELKDAVIKNDITYAQCCIILGAKINELNENTIPNLLKSNKTEIAKFILKHPFLITTPENLDLYFNIALINYLDDIVEILIKKHSYDINKTYKDNKTYLEYFIDKKSLKIPRFLIKHGAWKFRDGSHLLDHMDEIQKISHFWNQSLIRKINDRNIQEIKDRINIGANPHEKKEQLGISIYRWAIDVIGYGRQLNEICQELLKANGDLRIVDPNTPVEDLCAICMDIKDGQLYPTKCKHYFHIECLNNWLNGNGNGKCPTCRTEQ